MVWITFILLKNPLIQHSFFYHVHVHSRTWVFKKLTIKAYINWTHDLMMKYNVLTLHTVNPNSLSQSKTFWKQLVLRTFSLGQYSNKGFQYTRHKMNVSHEPCLTAILCQFNITFFVVYWAFNSMSYEDKHIQYTSFNNPFNFIELWKYTVTSIGF